MLRAIAIDDEPKALDVIVRHCQQVPFVELIKTFRHPVEALDFLQNGSCDLVFADINMPGLSGLQLSKLLKPEVLVIFTTAYAQYAVDSYSLDAVDYLLKPIELDRFIKAVMKARERKENSSDPTGTPVIIARTERSSNQIFIKSGSRHFHINTSDILFIRKDGNYAEFHLQNKKIIARLTLPQLEKLLGEPEFIQVHKSFMIAVRHIEIIGQSSVTINGQVIPVSQSYREKVKKLLPPE